MKYKGDIYLIESTNSDGMYLSTLPNSVTGMKTVGVKKDAEIEFDEYDDTADLDKKREEIQAKIDGLQKELGAL